MKIAFALALSVVLAGCGSSGTGGAGGGSTGGGAGGGTGGGTAGGSGGGTGGGSAGVALTVAECDADAAKFEGANCTDKSNWTAVRSTFCPKIPNTPLCNPSLVKAKACHAQFQTATMTCTLGNADTTEVCAVDVLFGLYCLVAINNLNCAGTACTSSLDCATNYGCNEKVGKCFNQSAVCYGLPCTSSLHCPTGQTCNSAAGQCVKN